MIDQPNLLRVNSYKINDNISVHVPTAGEIFDFGDQKYYSIVQSITSTPFDLMVELDDIGIDYESITDYQLFLLMFESIAFNEDNLEILFENINIKNFREAENSNNGERILYDKETGIIIDQLIAFEICKAIRKIHFWKPPEGKAGNTEAKNYLIQRKRLKKQRMAKRPYESFLENVIVSLVNTEEYKYNYEESMDLSVYKINASLHQIQKKKNWDQIMSGAYFGTVDLTKINLDKISWLSMN